MTNLIFILIIAAAIIIATISINYSNALRQTPALLLELTIDNIKTKGIILMINLTTTQQVSGQLQPVNSLGKPAPVETGTVQITSSDENVIAIERNEEDETKFIAVAKGPGVAQINYSADADMGEGVASIAGFTGVEVVPAGAVGFGITFGTPEEQPAPASPGDNV